MISFTAAGYTEFFGKQSDMIMATGFGLAGSLLMIHLFSPIFSPDNVLLTSFFNKLELLTIFQTFLLVGCKKHLKTLFSAFVFLSLPSFVFLLGMIFNVPFVPNDNESVFFISFNLYHILDTILFLFLPLFVYFLYPRRQKIFPYNTYWFFVLFFVLTIYTNSFLSFDRSNIENLLAEFVQFGGWLGYFGVLWNQKIHRKSKKQ